MRGPDIFQSTMFSYVSPEARIIHSERLLMEQLQYNLLFRWFVGLNMDDLVWDPTTFTKNRHRLISGQIAQRFFALALAQARARGLLSDEHFSVGSTYVEAYASLKSFRQKDETHLSTTTPTPGWRVRGRDEEPSSVTKASQCARLGKSAD